MAESLVGKIASNRGKQWSRNTVADGNWLNSNTIQKFNENDITLAEAIEDLSAAMEHFTPEITPSAWDCESKQTIKSLRQSSDGHLEVELQPIDFGETTLSDKVWAYLHQTGFKQVVNQYQDITVGSGSSQDYGFNLVAGELTDNTLSLQAGIYDIKIELLYNTSKTPVEHIVKVGLFLNTVSESPIIEDHCYFNDSYTIENNVAQVRWLNFTIKVDTASSLKIGVTSPDGSIGQVCANKVLIMSAGGATGKQGEPGPQGPNGISPTVNVTDITGGKHIVISGADGEHPFDIMNGVSGKSPTFRINAENAHWQWKYDDQSSNWADVPNTPAASGTKGDNGYSPVVNVTDITDGHRVTITDETHQSTPHTFDVKNGISPTVSTSVIEGGNRVTFTYDDGGTSTTKSIDVMSGVSGEPGRNGTNGTDGTDGVSPSIATEPIAGSPAGTRVIITDATHPSTDPLKFDVMNGRDGAGATYTFDSTTLSGNDSTEPIGVDTGYIASKTWVGEQGFLKNSDLTDYATKTYANEASANALNQAETWVGQQGFITKDVNDLTNYYKKSETSAASELSTEFGKYLQDISISTDSGWGNVPYLSGNGENQPLGIHNQYTNAWNDKTHVSIDTATNEIKLERNSNSAISAMTYIANESHAGWEPQKSCVCQESEIYAMSKLANGQGMLFFVVSAHN